eukprot:CAMPEP_0172744454 /NCGR_PEP_ID=MMETSP1074-20121228/135272_1 /TAXON_ID=2916 /ORGANISM="Ceratium fusus, Strain PA161109" /LENGTH=43 /DNA_ID= /DNA_START= /DNA_END= /DNA_ORIENTATION=
MAMQKLTRPTKCRSGAFLKALILLRRVQLNFLPVINILPTTTA